MKMSRAGSEFIKRLLHREVDLLEAAKRAAVRTANAMQKTPSKFSARQVNAAWMAASNYDAKIGEAISVRDGWDLLMRLNSSDFGGTDAFRGPAPLPVKRRAKKKTRPSAIAPRRRKR